MENIESTKKSCRLKIAGWTLIVISCLMWGALFIVHKLPLDGWSKTAVYAGLISIAEIVFWAGGVMIGIDYVKSRKKNVS
jgi:hypothetical protein